MIVWTVYAGTGDGVTTSNRRLKSVGKSSSVYYTVIRTVVFAWTETYMVVDI